jgi:hypothetical protein
MNSSSGTFHLKPYQVSVENVRISRDEGIATGSFVLDLRAKKLAQLEAKAHLQPAAMAAWFEPSLLPLFDHLQFPQAPDLTLKSAEQDGRTDFSMHINMVAGVVFRCGLLEVPLASASADLRQIQDEIQLTIPNGRIGAGLCSVAIHQMHPNAALDSEVTFDRVSLSDLKIRSPLLAGWQGQLSGSLKSRFGVSDSSRDTAEGKLVLDAADLSGPIFVEPEFKKLISAGFNRLGQLTVEFVANLGLLKISRLSLAAGQHVLDLSGSVDFSSAAINLSGRLDQDAGTARITGSITDPDWEILFPRRD